MDEEKTQKTPDEVLVICKTISGTITQQHGNHRYLASPILDDLKHIHSFLLKQVSTSFGCDYDEGGNLKLSELHTEVAYGILPELVSHVLKMDAQADGDFARMYRMVVDIFCYLTAVCSVELMAFLFSTFASLLLYFNEMKPLSSTSDLRTTVMYRLCYYMFPLCLVHPRSEGSFCHTMVPAILGSVLDTTNGETMKWCTQMLDVLMSLKRNICLDIITLISSGTKRVRKQAEKILMHYWLRPPEKKDDKNLKAWQLEKCRLCHRMADLVCINPACGTHKRSEDKCFHLCKFCHTRPYCEHVFPIAKPIGFENRLSGTCQLRLDNCSGNALLACFHPDCISLVKTNQSFIRLCSNCIKGIVSLSHEMVKKFMYFRIIRLLEDMLAAHQDKSKESQSLDYDNTAAVLMLDQYCQCPTCELDDDMHNWMVHLVSLVLNWLYEIIDQRQSATVKKTIIPWLVNVLHKEVEYVAESVLPNLPEYAQVGKLWNSVHSMVERRQHTLEIIEMLQNKILTESRADRFYQVFDSIMPFWLKELSSLPDQLESLKDYFKKLFEVSKDDKERKRKFEFIKTAFNDQDLQKTKEALCWLQALTRMNITIPFLKEIIQQAVQRSSPKKISSFDVKASGKHISAVPSRRSSWSDSEHSDASTVSGLMTHSSVEYTGDILDVDSTLTRYILMLDVWLSQIKFVKDFSIFQFSDIQNIILCMLKESHYWGSFHNHNRPSEICLLCYAIVLWFNLANLIFEKYTSPEPMHCPDDEDDSGPTALPRASRPSFFYKFFAMRRTTTLQEHYNPESRPSIVSSSGSVNESQDILTSPVREKPSPCHRERKMARVDTHTNYTFVSQSLQENPRKKTDNTGTLYKIFQECLKWWRPLMFIPEATHHIILFITTLFRNSKLLCDEASYSTYITDVEKLITNLWNSLICEYTYLAKAAVSLLSECLEFLAIPADIRAKDMDLQQIKFRSMVDSKFEQDSYTKRFEVVEKAFLIVQFTENVMKLSAQTQLSLSCVFCHLVGSLQDSSSHVATRAQYCLRSLKHSAIVAIQDAMTSAFNKYVNHRSQILTTMSILNSNLPTIPTSPIKFFVGLEPYMTLLKDRHSDIRKRKKGKGVEERSSIASHSMEIMNKYLSSDSTNAMVLQRMLALLMQILADPQFKASLLDEVIEIPLASTVLLEKGVAVIMEFFRLIVCQHFAPLPVKLRESHFFETYLRNIYQVLDVNTAFGNSLEVLSFNLRLLIFSTCSSYDEYQSLVERMRQTNTSLALLEPNMCLAWLKVFFVICYKYVDQILQSEEKENLQDFVLTCVAITLRTLQRSPHHCIPPPQQKLRSSSIVPNPMAPIHEQAIFQPSAAPSRNPSVVSTDSSNISLAMATNRQADPDKCPLCNAAITTVHSEEIITQCVVTLSTALHHMPVLTLRYLIDSINALARVALPDTFSWDNAKVKDQTPNSASNVAKQYLKCLLTQHGDRKLFLYLFKYCDSKALMQAIFSSLPPPAVEQENSASVSEGEDSSNKNVKAILDQISPVQYFLEDLPEEPNILRRHNVIINLSNYLHLLEDSNGRKSLVFLIPQFKFFFEKVKQLPKTVDVEPYNALIKIMILVTNILIELPQSLLLQQFASYYCAILSLGFKYTVVPLHGLVILCSSWYRLLESHSLNFTSLDSIICTLNNELVQVLKMKVPNVPGNFTTVAKFFILCFHGNVGYINDIFNDGKMIFCRDLHENQFFDHVAKTLCQQSTLLECLGFLCCRMNWLQLRIYEFKLHVSKLLVTNLCSGTPSKDITGRLQQIDATLSASPSEDRTVLSVLKTSASFLVALGWMMMGAMKLTAMRQIFNKQLSEAAHEWEADDISGFLYQIWDQEPLNCVNTVVKSTLNLIVKNCTLTGLDKDVIKNVFLFLEIWTVYLEVVLPKGEDNTVVIVEVWRDLIHQVSTIPMVDITISIMHNLNKAVYHIKRAELFLTTKITPFWRETRRMGDTSQYCTELWKDVGETETTIETGFNADTAADKQTNCCAGQRGLDPWYNCMLQRMASMETDYRSDIMG